MNLKRTGAILGLAVIGLLYAGAVVCALIDHPSAKRLLMAAVFCTIVLPVVIYTWQLMIRHLKSHRDRSGHPEDLS